MMKWLFLCFVLIHTVCLAQTLKITGLKNKTAYACGLNEIHVEAEGFSCKSLIISTDNGRIEKMPACGYNYVPKNVGVSNIYVKAKVNKKIIDIGFVDLVIKDVEPIFFISFSEGGEITKSDIAAQGYVRADAFELGCVYYIAISVDRFTVKVVRDSKTIFEKNNSGNEINLETRVAFKKLQKNDVVLISNIICRWPDERIKQIKSTSFKIID